MQQFPGKRNRKKKKHEVVVVLGIPSTFNNDIRWSRSRTPPQSHSAGQTKCKKCICQGLLWVPSSELSQQLCSTAIFVVCWHFTSPLPASVQSFSLPLFYYLPRLLYMSLYFIPCRTHAVANKALGEKIKQFITEMFSFIAAKGKYARNYRINRSIYTNCWNVFQHKMVY